MNGWSVILKSDSDMPRLSEYLRLAIQGGPQVVTVKPYKAKRTLAQNSLMWLWYDEISKHIFMSQGYHYSSQDVHEYFKQLLLPKRVIEFRNKNLEVQIGTSELNVMDMMDYLDRLDHYCAEKLNLMLSKPEDLWNASKGY